MINLLIGGIIGTFVTMIGWGFLQTPDMYLTLQTITNVVIALAAIVALVINYFSIKHQKDSRLWEINKTILLEVCTALSDLLKQTQKLSDITFENEQGIPAEGIFSPDDSLYSNFERYLSHIIDAYGPLLDEKTINAIKDYKISDKNIEHRFDIDQYSLFEAYEASTVAQKTLLKALNQSIKRYASI